MQTKTPQKLTVQSSKMWQLVTAHQAGFTMVELLIVVVIIGILSVIGLNNFISSQLKARDSQRKSDLATLSKALEMYFNDKNQYPADTNGEISDIDWGDTNGFVDNTITNGAIYLPKMPKDPSLNKYFYDQIDASTYRLCALLENTKDREAVTAGYSGTDCRGGTTECNYCISSSNITVTP